MSPEEQPGATAPATARGGRPRVAVVVPAGGSASRLGGGANKVLLPLGGRPMIRRAVEPFQAHPRIGAIVVAIRPEDEASLEAAFPPGAARDKLRPWVRGGKERQHSVLHALEALAADPPDWVLVHDGARPFCPAALIDRVLDGLARAPAAVPVIPVGDSLRRLEPHGAPAVSRQGMVQVQTPQGFHWHPLWEAHRRATATGRTDTDDAQLVEAAGTALAFVEGAPENFKVTTPAEQRLAERLAG